MSLETVFKAYDIRGLVDGELSEKMAYQLGRAFVVFLKESGKNLTAKKLVVGQDMRSSSPAFAKAVSQGLLDEGVDVVDIGLCSTPLFNFACAHYPEQAGGIMVTASHNPAKYNGFKITLENGLPVGENNGLKRLKELVLADNFLPAQFGAKIESKNVYPDYEAKIFSLVNPQTIKPMKLVIDAGNGMAKVTIPKILAKLPIEVEYLYLEPDGNFPNHEANPLKTETLRDLQKKVMENKADFGFALDGDADRIGLIDELGEVVPASFVGGLIGLEVLKKHPAGLMLMDLRCSRSVKETWEKLGAKTDLCKVGHANIKKSMKERGAIFASELSLHVYYNDLYDLESPDLSLLYILKILSEQNQKLSELWKPLNYYFHSGEINFEVENKEEILEKLAEKYADAEINKLDGLLFTYPDLPAGEAGWWFSIRASNTEPVLRLNLEAKTEEVMKGKVKEVRKIIEE